MILIDQQGSDEEEMYQYRKRNNDFNPGRNKGWIKILVPPLVAPMIIFAQSEYGEHHTEEKLVQLAQATYHLNLATSPTAPLNAGPRILAMYTERRPCDSNNADESRRTRNSGNCNDYLHQTLNGGVSVGFSVANNNQQHMTLLGRQSLRALAENDIDALGRYAQAQFQGQFQRILRYIPTPSDYATCRLNGLDRVLGIAYGILRSSVTTRAVAQYHDTTTGIEQDVVLAQLEIDKVIDTFLGNRRTEEDALTAEGDRLAAESRRQALFPWEKENASF